ncbi:hypothetical protein PSU4_44350 [Pseudonocardia sulfidoxydans NBRC 16205]|uniref:Uncharacterized protein n=1 Tax=Pseudonocardia sulfidoxydans NBRC 16205 TaxID=1223511 RepID=A0A511DKY6_9PSEU|nr:hypothetical protein [Pseudonocardia sulfidoxydans]GEL25481.1 hypothetical protein PSU4_44350 [Pseudonocardia sulfidoxydans NBRC 16205]
MTSPDPEAGPTCDGHSGVAGEARALLAGLIDRLQPMLDRYLGGPVTPSENTTCASCPVCALVAVLRGERPELGAQLAEHASGLLAVLRAALDEGAGATAPPGPPTGDEQPCRPTVQRITVTRG